MTGRAPRTTGTSRRAVLAGLATGTVGGLAGCLGDDRPEGVVLDPPEKWDRIEDAELAHPKYGDRLPEATALAPLHGREVTTTEFAGERHVMLTFVFTRCSTACPLLTSNLVHVQADSVEKGYADEFAFLASTFDPAYDTPSVLESYGEERGADREAGNWWFLRPADEERAEEVVAETFGVQFEYVPEDEREMENMAWIHGNLILLANEDGYVERAYTGEPPNPADVLGDVTTLRERW